LKNVGVVVEPTPEAVKALASHICSTGRAYALADVARMVLQARDRYQLVFRIQQPDQRDPRKQSAGKGPAAGGPSEFFHGEDDGSLWLSRDEAVAHVLRSPVLKQYYTAEEIEVEPPKGNFSVIAVCGMSGTILGPPNHHEYQTSLARLHRERFSGMSFERFKSRIEMHRDEETLEKWKNQVSRKRIYRVGPTIEEDTNETEEESAPESSEKEPGESAAESPAPEETEATTPEDAGDAESAQDVDEGADEETPAESAADSPAEAESEIEETADEPGAASDTEGAPEDDTSTEEAEAESTEEDPPEADVLNSQEELARHFREHYADEAIKPVTSAVVSGNIPGRDLSGPLLSKLKSEVEKLRRGFPLPMIQELCRHFEKEGLRFFKRGKKTLYVSVIRPRAIKNEEAFTDRIRSIVAFVREHPHAKVVQLLDALVPDYQPPKGGESFKEHHLTESERAVLADLRWLTMEGYVIEFPNSELLLGARDPSGGGESKSQPPATAKASRAKAKTTRPRRPKKKKGRNMPVPNPLKAKAAEGSPAAASGTAEPASSPKPDPVKADAPPETASVGESVEAATDPEPDPVSEKAEAASAPAEPEIPKPPVEGDSSATESGAPDSPVTGDAAASEPEREAPSESALPSPGDHEKAGASSVGETPAESTSESGSAPDDEASSQDTSVTS